MRSSGLDHERRIRKVEDRVTEIESVYGDSLYRLHRFRARTEMRLARMMHAMNVEDITEDDVDEFLDAEE